MPTTAPPPKAVPSASPTASEAATGSGDDGCTDAPVGWADVEGYNCATYAEHELCTADGEYGPSERAHFEKSVGVLTDGKLAGEDFDHVVTRLSDALRRQGRDGCIASLKQRLDEPQLRQIALILAADMAAADGVLHPEERAVVLAMARAFGVGEDAAREVLDGPPS